jgi:hypothetical protein
MRTIYCTGHGAKVRFSDYMTESLCLMHDDMDAGIFTHRGQKVPVEVRHLKTQLRRVIRHKSTHAKTKEYAAKKLKEIKSWPNESMCVIS